MSIFDLRRRGTHQHETPLVMGPLPALRVPAANSQPSVSPSPACGALDRLSGAVCTLPRHSDPIHEDRADPLTAVRWRHDEHTTRRPEVATK